MSQPNITAERMEATYKAICWECSEEFFEGNVKEIEEWAKKNDHDLNWDEMEEGFASVHCYDCSYIYHL